MCIHDTVAEHISFHIVFEFKQVFKIMYTSKVLKQQNSLVVFLASGPTCGLLCTLTSTWCSLDHSY